jgi:LuxR family maltose regulon positive regulatory protein
MFATLLATKFFIPQSRPHLVSRPQLVLSLNAESANKLTLVSAPPGFGKTSLLCEWVNTMDGAGELPCKTIPRVAWLSLDESDNDPIRFLAYCITALKQVEDDNSTFGESALGMLQTPQPPPLEAVLTALINDLAALRDTIFLVLDDYHLIENQSIHAALAFLLDHLPPRIQLIIATRIDPPLPLARLRVRNQLTEIRAADLRFTTTEAENFLNQVMNLDLSSEDIHALENRTEGWVAGLQLAALSIQGTQDATEFIESFTGSHRYVLDYLIEEVLEQQSETIQRFLLRTSILERLNGALCAAVTGEENQQEILEYLEHANLFIVPLDDERQWYRYHRLFADLLQQRLEKTLADQLPTLHERASHWYELNRFLDEAIEHALRAGNVERAVQLTTESVESLWNQGEHAKLQSLLARLPLESINAKPHLSLYNAWYSFVKGQLETAEESLKAAAKILDHHPAGTLHPDVIPSSRKKLDKQRGRIAAIRTFMKAHQGDVEGLIHHGQQALTDLPDEDRIWRSLTAITLGDVYGFRGDMTKAYKARYEAYAACRETGASYYCMLAGMKLAITLRSQGRLAQTMEICRQQVQIANEYGLSHTPLNGLLLLIWAEVLRELDELDSAYAKGTRGLEITNTSIDMTLIGWGYMCMSRILLSKQDWSGIEDLLHRTEEHRQQSNLPPWIMNLLAAWQARLWLVQGNITGAIQWVQDRGLITGNDLIPPEALDYFALMDYILLARIWIAQEQPVEAVNLLTQLCSAAAAGGRISRQIEIQCLLALAYQANGNSTRAVASLEQALTLAEPEGFIRTFVDEGPPMARLLYEALSRGIAPDYVRHLLAAFPVSVTESTTSLNLGSPTADLIEPLSEREQEVLQLIAEGLTNREIAARLYVTLNTVKAHTRNIFGKLGVKNRTQAVHKAKSLGVLTSE